MFYQNQHPFRAPASVTVDEFADQIRAAVMPFRTNLDRELFMRSAAIIIHDEARGRVSRGVGPWWSPMDKIKDSFSWELERANRFSLQVIPHGDHFYLILHHYDKTYDDLVFGPGKSYVDAILGIDGVESYFPSTEYGSNRLNAEQQTLRTAEWTEVLDGKPSYRADDRGIFVSLGGPDHLLDRLHSELEGTGSDDLLARQTDPARLRLRLINRAVRTLYYKDDQGRHTHSEREAAHEHYHLIRNTSEWMAEDDRVVGRMVPLTLDMIHGKEMHPPIHFDWELFRDTLEGIRQEARDAGISRTSEEEPTRGRMSGLIPQWIRRTR